MTTNNKPGAAGIQCDTLKVPCLTPTEVQDIAAGSDPNNKRDRSDGNQPAVTTIESDTMVLPRLDLSLAKEDPESALSFDPDNTGIVRALAFDVPRKSQD